MQFNTHFHLKDKHAFLSPSKYHWMNYDDDKLDRVFLTSMTAQRGTELHQLAHDMIRLKVKAQGKTSFAMYVNHAIGYRMVPEQTLYYSDNCFGHADAISFRRGLLRIHDLKNGVTATSEHQLEVYAALFCLEYMIKPFEIEFELRIYQNDEVRIYETQPETVVYIMDKITTFDKRIENIKKEVTL